MIEPLESRIAPAAVVHFTEADGDKITVKTNRGTKEGLEFGMGITDGAAGIDGFTVDLNKFAQMRTDFNGTNLTISCVQHGNGDGIANKVVVDNLIEGSFGIDLGKVKIKGSLLHIDAGDADLNTLALKKLTVTEFAGSGQASTFEGDVGKIIVKQDMNGNIRSQETFSGPNGTSIGSLLIGGGVSTVTAGPNTGFVQVNHISKLDIKGIIGGDPNYANNGIINVVSADNVHLGHIAFLAQIQLSQATA